MDLELAENGNGGDFIKTTKDLSVILGFENMIYLGLCGGNTEASTPAQRIESEQDFSWWGNALLMPNDTSLQMNSITERRLREVAINSSGRIQIENGIKADLDFMKPFAKVSVAVTLVSLDRIAIAIRIRKPDNLEPKRYLYIWDATIKELEDRTILVQSNSYVPDLGGYFDDSFDSSFE